MKLLVTRVLLALALIPMMSVWAQSPPKANKRPSLAIGAAFSPEGRLWVAGINAQGRLFVQHTAFPGTPNWSEPKVLDTGDDEIAAEGESRPKIAFGPKGWTVITYTQPLPKPYTGHIRMLRSDDGGRTFGRPFTVHDDRQIITHRFESVAFDGQGRLVTVWVDKRDQVKAPGQPYAGAAIYRKISDDGGKTFEPDQKLADHSCECCRIALAQNAQGQLFGLWRHVFPQQIRDHAFAALTAPAPQLQRASFDEWRINACPHHGPGLAYAAAQPDRPEGFHMVWFGIRAGAPAVRYVRLSAQGAPMEHTLRSIPDDAAEHADVMSLGPTVAIVWRSFAAGASTLHLWHSKDGGASFQHSLLGLSTGFNDHPRLAQSGSKMAVVWRNTHGIEVYDITP
ncbi:MAG: hypothetical protein RIT26_1835 [Pseudomonadota bacterium]